MTNDTSPAELPAVPREDPRRSIQSLVGTLHVAMAHMTSGDRAELRRSASNAVPGPAFWKLSVRYLEPSGAVVGDGAWREELERRWGAICGALAELEGLHRHGAVLGAALARAGLSELRFVRLLEARESSLSPEIRRAVHFLASKAQAVDVADMARLVLSEGRPDAESVRRQIARDYYRTNLSGS